MPDDARLEHEIRVQATRCGVDVHGLCPVDILLEWAERDIGWARTRVHQRARGEELEAENRELRKRVRELEGGK